MYRIKKINILSLAINATIIYFIIGVILGIIIALLKSNPVIVNSVNPDLLRLTYLQIVVLYPIAYAAGGFIISLFVGIIYNLVVQVTGGIAIHLVKDSDTGKKTK